MWICVVSRGSGMSLNKNSINDLATVVVGLALIAVLCTITAAIHVYVEGENCERGNTTCHISD